MPEPLYIAPADRIETSASGTDYVGVTQVNTYDNIGGLVVLPVAGRESKYRLVRLHGGYSTRKVRWGASRDGRPPVVPAAVDTQRDTLLSARFEPHLPTPSGDNGYHWKVEGEYLYVQKFPRYPGQSAFPVGDYPFAVLPQSAAAETAITGLPVSPSDANIDRAEAYAAALWTSNPPTNADWTWTLLVHPPQLTSTTLIV